MFLNDPLLIRYRNDPVFRLLVKTIRRGICEAEQNEATWRDAIQMAFELERQEPWGWCAENGMSTRVTGDNPTL